MKDDNIEEKIDILTQQIATLKIEHQALVEVFRQENNELKQEIRELKEKVTKTEKTKTTTTRQYNPFKNNTAKQDREFTEGDVVFVTNNYRQQYGTI